MTPRSGNRFAVLENHRGLEDDQAQSPNIKKKKSKGTLSASPQKQPDEDARSNSVSRNKQTEKAKMTSRPIEVSENIGLRGRNTAPLQSADDLLEMGAGKNTPSSQKTQPRIVKRKSKNIIKLSKRDGKLPEPHPSAPSIAALSSKDKRAMALLVVLCKPFSCLHNLNPLAVTSSII